MGMGVISVLVQASSVEPMVVWHSWWLNLQQELTSRDLIYIIRRLLRGTRFLECQ